MSLIDKSIIRLSNVGVVAFKGNQRQGYNLVCKSCRSTLIQDTYEKQILGLFIECAVCHTLKTTHHRLVELIEYAQNSAKQLEEAGGINKVTINGDLISELLAIVTFFQRWKHHPSWPELIRSLANSDDVLHNTIQLISASYLA